MKYIAEWKGWERGGDSGRYYAKEGTPESVCMNEYWTNQKRYARRFASRREAQALSGTDGFYIDYHTLRQVER